MQLPSNTIKRIAHYSPGLASTFGGVESVLLNILDAFHGHSEYKFSILSRNAHLETDCGKTIASKDCEILSLGIPHLTPLNVQTFRRQLRNFFLQNKVDILHMHSMDEPFVISEARRAGVSKIIIHIHTPTREHNGINRYYNSIKNICARRNFSRADTILAVSQDTALSIQKLLDANHQNIEIIHNSINTDRFSYNENIRARYREALGLSGVVVGHIARFDKVKNHCFLLDIFDNFIRRTPQATLLLVGDGPLKDAMEERAAHMGLKEKVRFVGERPDIPGLMCAMDAFVLPSLFEGFPLVIIEAQCSGLPCLVSNGVPSDVAITDLVTHFKLSNTPQVWAEKLCSMLEVHKQRCDYDKIMNSRGYGVSGFRHQLSTIYK